MRVYRIRESGAVVYDLSHHLLSYRLTPDNLRLKPNHILLSNLPLVFNPSLNLNLSLNTKLYPKPRTFNHPNLNPFPNHKPKYKDKSNVPAEPNRNYKKFNGDGIRIGIAGLKMQSISKFLERRHRLIRLRRRGRGSFRLWRV